MVSKWLVEIGYRHNKDFAIRVDYESSQKLNQRRRQCKGIQMKS